MKNFSLLFLVLLVQLSFAQKQRFSSVVRTNRLTTAPYYVEIDYPRNLPGLIARYRADSLQTIIDNTNPTVFNANNINQGNNASEAGFNGTVFQWLDISQDDMGNDNNNHLTAHNNNGTATSASNSATYLANAITNPSYRSNATVRGDGNNDHLFVDINPNITQSFTFIFVMQALNSNPGTYNSFIASSTGHNGTNPSGQQSRGAWQISTTADVTRLYFRWADRRRSNNPGSANYNRYNTRDLILHNYDTDKHVYYIEYDDTTRELRIEVDGVIIPNGVYTITGTNNSPVIDNLKLWRNRAMNSYLRAEFHEFFLSDEIFDSSQKQLLTNYLLAKWGI